jgi:hypothetical protein
MVVKAHNYLEGDMADLLSGLVLVIAASGIVATAGGLVWCWIKLAPRIRRRY